MDHYMLSCPGFSNKLSVVFGEMLEKKELLDVTLVCDDDKSMRAHQVILSAASSFFRNVFKRFEGKNGFVYLRGVKHEDCEAIVQFLYHGETQVAQDNLTRFMDIAKDLKILGLAEESMGPVKFEKVIDQDTLEKDISMDEIEKDDETLSENIEPTENMGPVKFENINDQETLEKDISMDELEEDDETLSENIEPTDKTEEQKDFPCDECDQLFKFRYKLNSHKKQIHNSDYLFLCKQCTFQTSHSQNLKRHIQSKHELTIIHCDNCDFECNRDDRLKAHKLSRHNILPYICSYCDFKASLKKDLLVHISKNHLEY